MGQKVHPTGYRLVTNKGWNSIWYADRNYAQLLHEDLHIKDMLKKKLYHAGIAKIEVERAANKVTVSIFTARPGIVIGKRGAGIDALKAEVQQLIKHPVFVNIREVRKAEIDATLVAENIATQLERRVAFRRAMKKSISSAMKLGALGVKIGCAGRLGGAEMARRERYMEGRVPLHTLRADVDYGTAVAKTTYGAVGVKVWIFKGETSKSNAADSLPEM